MDSNLVEPMDFLSRDWCNSSAIQIFQPSQEDRAIVLQDHSIKSFCSEAKTPLPNMDDGDIKLPKWKTNDVKSWILLQQAMHPEVNYRSCFRKKWFSWKIMPVKNLSSIKKWVKEIKQKRKEDDRLQRAEVHAAISVAGVAAALAAIAAENNKHNQSDNNNSRREEAVASAAALVAAQCAQMAEAMGAKRDQLSSIMGSAMTTSNATDILTLTAAAATSLRGAATLRARPGRSESRLTGGKPILPIDDKEDVDCDFDFERFRSELAKGYDLNIELSDGKCKYRSVSIILNRESKVILKTRKVKMLTSAFSKTKESVIMDLHAELYQESLTEECETCYYIVLTTSKGTIKLDMEDDHDRYRMWATTITHMLKLSSSFNGYQLQYY